MCRDFERSLEAESEAGFDVESGAGFEAGFDAGFEFRGRRVLVCGMARSGQAAALALVRLGAVVTATDTKSEIVWDYDPAAHGIVTRLGEAPTGFVTDFEIVVISPGISVYTDFVQKATESGIPVWGEAELAYRLCPCDMIAITGTNGKTTVTTLVGEILSRAGSATSVQNINFSGEVHVAGNIGVPLTSLVETIAPGDLVVAEISSFQLETIAAFRPKIAAVLNITEDHLDRHLTMENYIAAKKRIFENIGKNEICVLNYDNSVTKLLNSRGKNLFFSMNEEVDVFVRDGKIFSTVNENREVFVAELSETKVLPENALAATAIAHAAGAPVKVIAEVLREFAGVEHRLEFVTEIGGVKFYNDSKATNPDAAVKALEFFSPPVILIAGGSDKDANFEHWVKRFREKVTYAILIGETADEIARQCDAQNFASYIKVGSLEDAVRCAKEMARPGDIVLLSPACASFDMFKSFEDRGRKFKRLCTPSVQWTP
ncbi:MAG: UDP-N-acetylmuramoyl-L-alanine--D-glutamate ligase [Defluviitaleaceae bacterium]|nr:UDP-N-acetylmuramoyl-L-alanine--D-glutamate ligase [Defluviitaleaceae bacterium]